MSSGQASTGAEQPSLRDASALIDGARIGRFQILVALLCSAILFIDGFNQQIVAYTAPQIAAQWDVSKQMLGVLFSATIVGNFIGYLFVAPLAGRYGPKRVAIFCVALFGIGEVLAGLSQDVLMLMVFRFIAGIGFAGALPPSVALTGEYFPKRKRFTAITVMYAAISLGQIAAGEAASFMVSTGLDWRAVLAAGGAAALLMTVPLALFLPESAEYLINRGSGRARAAAILRRALPGAAIPAPEDLTAGEHQERKVSPLQLFENRRAWWTLAFWAAIALNTLVFFSFTNWITTMMMQSGHDQQTAIVITQWATGGAGIAGALIAGPAMDRFGPYRVMTALFVIGALAVTLLGAVVTLPLAMTITAMAFATGLCVSAAQKSSNGLAVFYYPTALRSTAIGYVLGVSRFGGVLGPILVGVLLHQGWPVKDIFFLMAGPLILAAILIAWMGRRSRAPSAPLRGAPPP